MCFGLTVVSGQWQQLAAYLSKKENPEHITDMTRSLLFALKRTWPKWMNALIIVKPETVIYWQQRRVKKFWADIVLIWRVPHKIGCPAS